MKTETKSIEQYLQGVTPPEGGSPRHFEELRGRLLAEVGGRPAPPLATLAWKVAAVCVVLAGTAYAGMKLSTYYFEGVGRDGAYHFSTAPRILESGTEANGNPRVVVRSSSVSIKEWPAKGVEQMQQQLQEIEILRQKDQGELIGVSDTLVNGHPTSRVFQYRYVLSDGTTREVNEGGSEEAGRTPEQARQDEAEIERLRAAGQRQIIGVLDIEHGGRIQRLLTCAYTLADGRTQIQRADSDPLVPAPENWLSQSQKDELWRLVRLDQGQPLSTEVSSLYGQTFTFIRRAYDIGGGKVVVMWDGRPREKWELKAQDFDELRRLRDAGAGELVGSYQEEVKGGLFTFEQRRYTLADGTVVLRAHGKPANN